MCFGDCIYIYCSPSKVQFSDSCLRENPLQTAHAAISQGHIYDFKTVQSNTQQTLTGLPVPLPGFIVELT